MWGSRSSSSSSCLRRSQACREWAVESGLDFLTSTKISTQRFNTNSDVISTKKYLLLISRHFVISFEEKHWRSKAKSFCRAVCCVQLCGDDDGRRARMLVVVASMNP